MDIKKKLREELLKEGKKATYEYGCTMVNLTVDKNKWQQIQDVIKDEDLYKGTKEDKDRFGREWEWHITALFGTHLDVPNEEVYDIIKTFEKPDIEFKSITMFETKNGYDVIKFDIESEKLKEYNKELKKLPYTSDFPKFHAHATIAYVLTGKGKEYINKLKDFKITKDNFTIDSFVYSKQGDKKSFKIK